MSAPIDDPTYAMDPTSVRLDWIGEERARYGMVRELVRLGRRARRRWTRTLVIALVLTGAAVGYVAHRPRTFSSRIAFRVTESALEYQTAPQTNKNLRDYVASVVFSNSHLLSIIKRHNLYASVMARDPSVALDSMREDIDVEVWRNQFELPREVTEGTSRSARVAITFHNKDRQVAYDVVRELGELVVESERSSRLAQAESALRLADANVQASRDFLTARKGDLVDKDVQRRTAKTPEEGLEALVEERNLERAVPRAEQLLNLAEKKREQAYMRVQMEKRALGIRWELIDQGRVEAQGPSRKVVLTAVAVIVFVITFPLCGVGVGAFDPRVYDLADVRRLGVRAVGAVRHFDGDNAGSLAERLSARARMTGHDGSG